MRSFYQLRTCCGPRSIEVQARKEGFPAVLVRACSLRQTRHVCKYNATLFLWKYVFSQCFYLKKVKMPDMWLEYDHQMNSPTSLFAELVYSRDKAVLSFSASLFSL